MSVVQFSEGVLRGIVSVYLEYLPYVSLLGTTKSELPVDARNYRSTCYMKIASGDELPESLL